MELQLYQIDTFTNTLFKGNPTGVILLERWLDDAMMQNIASENNLAETAFIVDNGTNYHIRWFTPEYEIDLCGHATLAAAFVMKMYFSYYGKRIVFESKSGTLEVVYKDNGAMTLILPVHQVVACDVPPFLYEVFPNIDPLYVGYAKEYLVVLKREAEIAALKPDYSYLQQHTMPCIIVTAQGNTCDFVSRYFIANSVSVEDPVTGSAHCSLIPYWASVLGKNDLYARQLSRRGGDLYCNYLGDKVGIGGYAVCYMKGILQV